MSLPACASAYTSAFALSRARGFCLLKGSAEGTYKTKHAEAARLYYTTIYPHTQTQTQTRTCLYGGRQASSLRDIARTERNQRLLPPALGKLGRGGDPGAESGDQSWGNARGAGRRGPVIVILAGVDERRAQSRQRAARAGTPAALMASSRPRSRGIEATPVCPVSKQKASTCWCWPGVGRHPALGA